MKQTKQTLFGKQGNCLETCLACIFELDRIPDSFGNRSDWVDKYDKFLSQYGLQVLTLNIETVKRIWQPAGYHIISGMGARGLLHSVVGYQGKAIFDPHPDNTFLEREETWDVFVANLNHLRDVSQAEFNEAVERATTKYILSETEGKLI